MHLKDMFIKDMKQILYDVKSLAIIILMPVVLMSILGMSLQGVFGEDNTDNRVMAHIGIVIDYDYNKELDMVKGRLSLESYSQETIDALDAQKNFFSLMDHPKMRTFVSYSILSEDEGFEKLEGGALDAVIVLPKNFIYNNYMILTGSRLTSDIAYYTNPDNDFYANILLGIIEAYADMNNYIYARQRLMVMSMFDQETEWQIDDMAVAIDFESLGIDVLEESAQVTAEGESINSFQYYAAAIMCMFLLYTAGIGGRALLKEKNDHTMARLRAGNVSLMVIMLSNFFRVMVLAMLQSVVMIVYSGVALSVDWGPWRSLLPVIVLSAFAVAGIGMFIAVVTLMANNYKIANAFEFGVVYLMALVGGSFVPVESLPAAIQRLGFISINGQALEMYLNSMYRLPLTESLVPMIVLVSFGCMTTVLAFIMAAKKGDAALC